MDLCEFWRSLNSYRSAPDERSRIAALEHAVTWIRGNLADGADIDWIDEERYPLTRAQCDALSQHAELTMHTEPERALADLERARTFDPDNDHNYLRIIQLQLDLDRPDAATRTARLLRSHLAELGLEPDPETYELLASLNSRRRNRPGPG